MAFDSFWKFLTVSDNLWQLMIAYQLMTALWSEQLPRLTQGLFQNPFKIITKVFIPSPSWSRPCVSHQSLGVTTERGRSLLTSLVIKCQQHEPDITDHCSGQSIGCRLVLVTRSLRESASLRGATKWAEWVTRASFSHPWHPGRDMRGRRPTPGAGMFSLIRLIYLTMNEWDNCVCKINVKTSIIAQLIWRLCIKFHLSV